jgi:hypothetical protein
MNRCWRGWIRTSCSRSNPENPQIPQINKTQTKRNQPANVGGTETVVYRRASDLQPINLNLCNLRNLRTKNRPGGSLPATCHP